MHTDCYLATDLPGSFSVDFAVVSAADPLGVVSHLHRNYSVVTAPRANRANISELGTSASDTRRLARTTGINAWSYMEHRSSDVTRRTSAPFIRSVICGVAFGSFVGIVAT